MKHLMRWSLAPLVGLAVLAVAGCVLHHPVKIIRGYPAVEPFNMRVALVLTEELRRAQWENRGTGYALPFGDHLAQNSEALTRALFSEASAHTDFSESTAADFAAILIPRVVFVEHSLGIWKWNPSTITMALEWTLKDRQGAIVWVDTVKGEGSTETGNAFTGRDRMRERAGLVIEDVFRKSFDAISHAQAIRDFAQRRPASPVGTGTVSAGSLPPGARALIGTWTGTLTRVGVPATILLTPPDRQLAVEVAISEERGGIRWTMTANWREQFAGGSASIGDDGGAVLAGVFGREADRLSGIAVQFRLRRSHRRLDGSGITGSNEIQELSLTR
jgi:hypothetical protein